MSKSNTKAKATTKAKAVKAAPKGKAAKGIKAVAAAPKAATLDTCYRQGGGYANSIAALKSLGVGKMHSHDAILKAVKKVYGTDGWKAFEAKAKGGKLSADERAILNVMVTSRKDYGKPVIECGYEVRWDGREKTAGLYKVGK